MKVKRPTKLPEIIIIEPDVFTDSRGKFMETYQAQRYLDYGIPDHFVQDNISYSTRGVLRGLHYQLGRPQGKLVYVAQGQIYDVAVDIRRGSPTFGKWEAVTLSSENHRQVYIPKGFAHGFCVTSETAIVAYKCTDFYSPKDERGILWNDPSFNIDWPIDDPDLSDKDSQLPTIEGLSSRELPSFS